MNNCIAENKIGVDPDCNTYNGIVPVICLSSDEYFNNLKDEIKFDLIFIDGMHTAEQVFKDVVNSINNLNENGYIILHDCIPDNEHNSRPYSERHDGCKWNGDVYVGYIEAINTYKIEHYTVDVDEGCGILLPKNVDLTLNKQKYINGWKYFEENKKELINVIDVNYFKKIFN